MDASSLTHHAGICLSCPPDVELSGDVASSRLVRDDVGLLFVVLGRRGGLATRRGGRELDDDLARRLFGTVRLARIKAALGEQGGDDARRQTDGNEYSAARRGVFDEILTDSDDNGILVFGVLSSLRLASGGHFTQANRLVVSVCLARDIWRISWLVSYRPLAHFRHKWRAFGARTTWGWVQ